MNYSQTIYHYHGLLYAMQICLHLSVILNQPSSKNAILVLCQLAINQYENVAATPTTNHRLFMLSIIEERTYTEGSKLTVTLLLGLT